jgi:protein ImuB
VRHQPAYRLRALDAHAGMLNLSDNATAIPFLFWSRLAMQRVVSLYLPWLPIERLRRSERWRAQPKPLAPPQLPIDDDPGACSVPRGGGWRPGARWARDEARAKTAAEIAALPLHQQLPMRELGRRSEAADHPFKGRPAERPVGRPIPSFADFEGSPLILSEQVGNRQLISAACPGARALGLTAGMAVTQARALVPELDVRPANPPADLAALERLALHAAKHWAPTAAVSGSDGLWLDLTGTAHLHGGEQRFCALITAFFRRLGLSVRIAIAGTPGAAHALARFGHSEIEIVSSGAEAQALARLPIACLRLEAEPLAAAARFGLECVADILPLPRGPLARRLGMPTVRRLDQALGRVAEPIEPTVPHEPIDAERRLLEPIGTPEAIEQVIADLLADLAVRLRERGQGARALVLSLQRVDASEQRVLVGTVSPTRDFRHLSRLFHLRIEKIEPGDGIEVMHLMASRTDPLGPTDIGGSLAGESLTPDVAALIDQLVGRAGPDAIFTIGSVESDVPERACVRSAPLATPAGWPRWQRPARLLSRPEPLSGVLALLPDHPPRRFTWRGKPHVVVAGDGPERILGEWWRRDGEMWSCRDYFRVEDEGGARFWLFRRGDGVDATTGDLTWHMHGLFG